MPPLPLSPGMPGIPGGPLDPNDPTNFMRSILDAQNRQRIWDAMGGLATGLIRASAPSREPQDLFGSAVAGALEGDKGGEDRGLKRAMTGAQLMQATQKLADDKQWRDMFGGADATPGNPAQIDRGAWPAMPAGGGAPAAPSAASPSPNPAGGGIAKALGDVQAGMPGLQLPVTSATRTPEQNRLVGGAPDSQHLHGNAYDISLKGFSDQQKQQIVTGFLAHPNVTGFGYYPESDSIHVDSRPGARMAWGADKTTATVGAGWPAWMTDAVGQWRGQAQPPGPVGNARSYPQAFNSVPPAVRQIIGASGREKGLPLLLKYVDPESVPAMDAVTGQVVFAPKTELGSGRYVPVDAARLGLEMRRENREARNADIVVGPDGKPAINEALLKFKAGVSAVQGTDAAGHITKAQADDAIKRSSEWQKEGLQAQSAVGQLGQLEALLNKITTGRFTGTTTDIKATAKAAGLNLDAMGIKDDVGAAQAAGALTSLMALDNRRMMPGPMSDGDRRFLTAAGPSITNDPEGNRILIAVKKGDLQRQIDIAKYAREYTSSPKFKTNPEGMDGYVAEKIAAKDYYDTSMLTGRSGAAPGGMSTGTPPATPGAVPAPPPGFRPLP